LRRDVSVIKSALYVPANIEARLVKALASAADAVIVDLEDGVPLAEKGNGRAVAATVIERIDRPWTALRINADEQFLPDDLLLAGRLDIDAIVLPKATAESVASLGPDGVPIWALIETARGLREAYEIACFSRVELLLLGTVDLALDLSLSPLRDQEELLHARSSLVIDSRAAEISAPLDGVCVEIRDPDLLLEESKRAEALGFGGKTCIHPRQLDAIHATFAASQAQIDHARRVVAAYESAVATGSGAISLDGQLVDKPVVEQARKILRAASKE